MAAIKLYFVLVSEDNQVDITVHRDLLTLQEAWAQADKANCVGLVHTGFIRPKLHNASSLLSYKGQVLVTVAAKWSLPDEYQSSVAVVAEMNLSNQAVPLHLLIKGLGFELSEPGASFESSPITREGEQHTIAEAALIVLNDAERPLNKEEIFARIIERDLYKFGAKKPVSVLSVELNRHSKNTEYSNPAAEPLFAKSGKNSFISLERVSAELKGWMKVLSEINPELVNMAASYGVYSDESFIANVSEIPNRLRDQLDLERFNLLRQDTDTADPIALLRILPTRLTSAQVGSLDLPVRILNVFNAHSIGCLSDLRNLSVDDMLKWPNFGRKSVTDLVANLLSTVDRQSEQITLVNPDPYDEPASADLAPVVSEPDEAYQVELVSTVPLRAHFEKALTGLKDNQRQIIECRTGYKGRVMTLESVGELVGVTRERIRQIQKQYVSKIIETEFWDDCIALKIGQLLIDREGPLYIEMLEVEDPWFEGFMGNYQHLAAIIELFSENEIRIIKINGASVVTRIKAEDWESSVSHFRKSLKDKSVDLNWTKHDIDMMFTAELIDKGAGELLPLMWDEFSDSMQFDGDEQTSRLIGFGKSADTAVASVMLQAEKPLHYSEVAKRATELLGKEVSERRAHQALQAQGGKLYARGVYGLAHFNPISERASNNIRLVVTKMIQDGPLEKQWHCSELVARLEERFPALPDELDHYLLNIILESSEKLVYLNRMVWARADSGQQKGDRVDMADAFTKILEDNGAPLKGVEIKRRLEGVRGVVGNLQIQPNDRMIQVGPDYWGLIERDVGGDPVGNQKKLNKLYDVLKSRQKGIHVTEVDQFVEVGETSSDLPSAYALLNLAQRDERFYLARSMFVGLDEWGGDSRRLNISQAVRKLLEVMDKPMTIGEIHVQVENLTEMTVDGTVTGVLINEGAFYNTSNKLWYSSAT